MINNYNYVKMWSVGAFTPWLFFLVIFMGDKNPDIWLVLIYTIMVSLASLGAASIAYVNYLHYQKPCSDDEDYINGKQTKFKEKRMAKWN